MVVKTCSSLDEGNEEQSGRQNWSCFLKTLCVAFIRAPNGIVAAREVLLKFKVEAILILPGYNQILDHDMS